MDCQFYNFLIDNIVNILLGQIVRRSQNAMKQIGQLDCLTLSMLARMVSLHMKYLGYNENEH